MAMEMEMALLAILALQLIYVSADDIVGCGGFVEASPALSMLRKQSDPKLDYSSITVELKTLEGLVKDRTQCAPNGYYYLPVYEKGSFLLQVEGPPGWYFTPSKVPVRVDEHGCNGNQDINFHYTGFTLSGKVLGSAASSCKEAGGGASGVKVSLNGQGDDAIRRSTVSGAGGEYKFEDLPTGSYELEASHPTLKVVLRGSNVVRLGWENGEVDDIFYVPGYSVEGSVQSKGIPVLGVQIFLHSDDVREIECPQGPGVSPGAEPALCHAISDAEGKFKFNNVPCGDYKLLSFYKGENTVFGVSPTSLSISVGHESLVVEESFQVTGFSVGGRVVDNNGNGIEQVRIFVDNIERAITDVNGVYKLDEVTSTRYTITAEKEHYKFTSLKDFMVLPNMASMPSIEAKSYDVCGSLRVVSQYGRRQVALTHGPSSVKPQTTRVDEAGNFCFEVPAGEYRLSPLATVAEQQAGLLFSPHFLDVVVSSPVLDIVFRQAEVTVSGYVKCKADCQTGVTVSLDHAQPEKGSGRVAGLGDDNEFKFENVLPGKYKLQVNKKRHEYDGDDWCWEQKKIDIEVLTADVRDLQFVQKGYWLRIDSTHAATATLDESITPLQIKKGLQELCIEKAGVHDIRLDSPCVYFGADSFTYDTSKPKVLRLRGEKYLLNGHIEVFARTANEANNLEKNLLVEVWDTKEGKAIATANALLVSEASETNPVSTYSYTLWARVGDDLSFVPRFSSTDGQSEVFLFYPRQNDFRVKVNGCQPKLPTFAARPGVYILGSVAPALEGVTISVVAVNESATGQLQAGSLAMELVTGDDGTFAAGPLYDETAYSLQATKAGYHFKQSGRYTFESQKLAEIVVNIVAGERAEETLPSVLLSLSGDDGYRKNAIASGGEFVFNNMFPGSFYLRPLLKEYSFSPPAQALELGSGESLEVTFTARRTGYSVFGTVTSLAGKPEAGVYVEARSESGGYYEETKTDADGKYRLRGLLPDAVYNVQVVIKKDLEESSSLERASPSMYRLKILNNDTSLVNFVVFEHMFTTLTGTVEGKDLGNWQTQGLAVQLLTTVEPEKVEKEFELPLSSHFEIRDVPKGRYQVRLVAKQPTQSHKFHSDVREVDLTKERYIHLDRLRFYAEEDHHKQELAPAPVFPVLIGIFVISLFAAVPSLKERLSANTATVAASMGRKDVPRTIQRKRI